MAFDEQQRESDMQVVKTLEDGKVLETTVADKAEQEELDPGKAQRDALNKKAHDYAVKGGSEETAYAGLLMKQVSAAGSDASGGKSKKDRHSRKAILDEILRQLAEINRQIQWYQDEIGHLEQELAGIESEVDEASQRLNALEALVDLRDRGELDPETNENHAAQLEALGLSLEAYIANPGLLDQAIQAERARIGQLQTQAQDLRTKIRDYGVRIDELEEEREEIARSLEALGEDPTLEQIKQVTAGKSETAVSEVAHDRKTSQETAEKVYEAIGLQGENLDDLAGLRSGENLPDTDGPLSLATSGLHAAPPFASTETGDTQRTTSSAKAIEQPPFVTESLCEAFTKAQCGLSEQEALRLEQQASADHQSAPGYGQG